MAHSHNSERLEALLAGVVAENGLELDAVIEAKQGTMALVRVIVDAPEGQTGVDSDHLAEVSRAVSKAMDVADPIDGEYLLEVSTPGAERELTQPRHWRKQIGRLIRAKMRDGSTLQGRLLEADEEHATLDVDGVSTTISYANVKKARPRVELNSEE